MQHLDTLYRVLTVSGTVEIIQILSTDPENEYLVHVQYVGSNKKSFINKAVLDRKWKSVAEGIQVELFRKDKTELYRKLFINKKRD